MKTLLFALLFGSLFAVTGPAAFIEGSTDTAQAQQCFNGQCPPA